MYSICDRNPQIRYESIELFRLALIISINRESPVTTQQGVSNGPLLNGGAGTPNHRIHRTSTVSSMESVASNHDQQQQQQQAAASTLASNENLEKFKLCFKNSVKELEGLLLEYTNGGVSSSSRQSTSSQTSSTSSREDRVHGCLLVILEIIRFSCLEFEQQIEKYLSTYNLYHQQIQKANNTNVNSTSSGTTPGSSKVNLGLLCILSLKSLKCDERYMANSTKMEENWCEIIPNIRKFSKLNRILFSNIFWKLFSLNRFQKIFLI